MRRGTQRDREMLDIYCVCIWMHMYMHIQAEPSVTLYTRAIRVTAGVLHTGQNVVSRTQTIDPVVYRLMSRGRPHHTVVWAAMDTLTICPDCGTCGFRIFRGSGA
jgi:hypothetical protein